MTDSEVSELAYLVRRDANARLSRCSGKEGFHSRGDALRAVSWRGKRAGAHAYRCTFCARWHLGTTIIPKGRRGSDADEKSASHVRHL